MNGLISSEDRKILKNIDAEEFGKTNDTNKENDDWEPLKPIPGLLESMTQPTSLNLKLGKPNKMGVAPGTLSISEEYKLEKEQQETANENEESNEIMKELEVEETKNTDINELTKPDESYADLCRQCVIRDLIGCDHCGIFIYGYRHKQFKISVEKIQ